MNTIVQKKEINFSSGCRSNRLLIFFILSFIFNSISAQPQTNRGLLSVDSLSEILLKDPLNIPIRSRLIEAYIQNGTPELALLEMSDAERLKLTAVINPALKGKLQAGLGQIHSARKNLSIAYIQSPDDETLFFLSLMCYLEGDTEMGLRMLKRLDYRTKNVLEKLFQLYSRYYLNNRKEIAVAISSFALDFDKNRFNKYFEQPVITIVSPSDGFSTEEYDVAITFEVKHTKPLLFVKVQNNFIVDNREKIGVQSRGVVNRTFTEKAVLSEGENTISVTVTDIYGVENVQQVSVVGMNFGNRPEFRSPETDSLSIRFSSFKSYVPEKLLQLTYDNQNKMIVLGSGTGKDSLSAIQNGSFLFNVLSNPLSGIIPANNGKLLIGDRANQQNISLVMNNWFLRSVTFQTYSTLYFYGTWDIAKDKWNVSLQNKSQTNLKEFIAQSLRLASAGETILFDGSANNVQVLENELQRMVKNSTTSVTAILLFHAPRWKNELLKIIAQEPSMNNTNDKVSEMSLPDLFEQINGVKIISNQQKAPSIVSIPGIRIKQLYLEYFPKMKQKLVRENADDASQRLISDYLQSWKRLQEIVRYVQGDLSLTNIIARSNEWKQRTKE